MAKKKTEWLQQAVCGNCRHFDRLDDSDQIPSEDVLGECLRYPPRMVAIEDGEAIQGLPIVEARNRCGEHGGVIN